MGLTISGNYENSIELSGGYGMFSQIRKVIALAFDKEFGEHYLTLSTLSGKDDYKEFNRKANEILRDERFKDEDEDIVRFLFMPDCDGKIGYKTCKKIYELIKDDNKERCLRYAAYSDNDWQDFKQLLKDCCSHRCNLVWY